MAQSLMPIWAPENLKLVNLFMNNHEMCECYEKWTIGLHRYDIKSLKYLKSTKLDFEFMKTKKNTTSEFSWDCIENHWCSAALTSHNSPNAENSNKT